MNPKDIFIRDMVESDAEQKCQVHYQSWIETYTGLINQDFLNSRSVEKCRQVAKDHYQNTIVAIFDNKIIGFACYNRCNDNDLQNAGEVLAIYILKDYHHFGIGRKLMDECLKRLIDYDQVVVWCLATNNNALGFYKHYGFVLDGKSKEHVYKTPVLLKRLVIKNKK